MGSDRPDNAELLPQNGAARLGKGTVHGHRVEVMTGPDARAKAGTSSTVHYWIGPDGIMYRVQAAVASESRPVVIDFDTHTYIPVPQQPIYQELVCHERVRSRW